MRYRVELEDGRVEQIEALDLDWQDGALVFLRRFEEPGWAVTQPAVAFAAGHWRSVRIDNDPTE